MALSSSCALLYTLTLRRCHRFVAINLRPTATPGVYVKSCFSTFTHKEIMPAKRKPAAAKAREPVEEAPVEKVEEDEPPPKKNGRGKAAAKPKKEAVEKTEPEEAEASNPPAGRKRRQAAITAQAKNNQIDKPDAPLKRSRAKEATKKSADAKKEDAKKETKGAKKAADTKKAKEAKSVGENGDAEKPKKGKAAAKPKPQASTSKDEDKEESATAAMNQTETNWEQTTFECTKANGNGDKYNTKIVSWNVDGLRAWIKKDGHKIMEHAKPDIICLQETKCSEEKVPDDLLDALDGYHRYWKGSDKEGYAGVALFSKTEPLEVSYGLGDDAFDDEGRCITAEYDAFYLVGVYVPNAGRKLVTLPKRLEWNEAFAQHVKRLDEMKPVVVCGDMNVAHLEIDLANPKTNTKNAGFTKEERDGMTQFLGEGYVDTFRRLYPDLEKVYTFWTYMMKSRSKNVGWRLDYFIVSERIMNNVCDNVVNSNVFGSDHCPITLFINI